MWLRRIEITDFLSVKGAVPIDIDKKVTILLGSNDHGKTNILKALQHLNDDIPITEEESNWDATDIPAISFVFSLSAKEQEEWKTIVEEIVRESEAAPSEEEGQEEGEDRAPDSTSQVAPQAATPKATGQSVPQDKTAGVKEPSRTMTDVLPASALNPTVTTLTLSRQGPGSPVEFEGVAIDELPEKMADFISERKPRVELFKLLGGNLQDLATADTIKTEEYEFLQGVFFYAGLDTRQSEGLFIQDDRTIRVLDEASKQLDESLRRLWAQGTELHFKLRHQGDAILFVADDPAIKSRTARMSKRSDGVTQFFRVSMILYARQKKNPANSYIYLFDEPGVLLHPQGQRDCRRDVLSRTIVFLNLSSFLRREEHSRAPLSLKVKRFQGTLKREFEDPGNRIRRTKRRVRRRLLVVGSKTCRMSSCRMRRPK